MRLEAVAHDAQEAADGVDADANDEDTSPALQPTEQLQPDNYTRPLKRLPNGHLMALAHAESCWIETWFSSTHITTSFYCCQSSRESVRRSLQQDPNLTRAA